MGTKVFRELNNIKLISDERDIMVPCEHHDEIFTWCHENNIKATTSNYSAFAQAIFGVLLWRVKNEQDRVLFALRWASE